MKYIIVAKNIYQGTSISDIANPLEVTEIATELIITRLKAIDMLQSGQISKEDCIVTVEERKCLYGNFFDNVIDYQYFLTLNINSNDVFDLLEDGWFHRMAGGYVHEREIPYKPFYQNWERDKELITNINFSDLKEYNLSQPFLSLVIRKRSAWTEKNMSHEFWLELIKKLEQNNIQIFVFGKETENYSSNKVQYIKNYQDWCSIVKHENCKHICSTMTGGVYPSLIFGNSNTEMTIIDNTLLMSKHGGDPSFYDNCINFSKIKIEFINYIPTIEELYARITTNL